MSREIKQAMRVFTALRRMTGGRLGTPGTVALCVVVVALMWWTQAGTEPGAPSPSVRGAPSQPIGVESAPRDSGPPLVVSAQKPRAEPSKLSEYLVHVGREVFESPAGLRYTPGSRHGHRLKHVMAHAEDQPDRVGQHGVFDSDESLTVVSLIDEAYEQALSGRRTRTRQEDGRVVYTVDLGRRIGYIGGQSGDRRGHPTARHLRLVLEDDRLITAYPVVP